MVLVPVSYWGRPGKLVQILLGLGSWALVLYAWAMAAKTA
jgi:hypothetical protein